MILVPVTLGATASCALLNIWLGGRVAAFRRQFQVSVGDGGKEPLVRRMRAQANFIENAPFVLILIAALEISGAKRAGLAIIGLIFIAGRVLHAIGMDGGEQRRFRMFGMMGSSLATLALMLWAILVLLGALLGR